MIKTMVIKIQIRMATNFFVICIYYSVLYAIRDHEAIIQTSVSQILEKIAANMNGPAEIEIGC